MKSFFTKFTKAITLSLVAITLISSPAFAQTSVPAMAVSADCFDYYKFQSVQVSIGPDKPTLKAGEPATFTGELINQNSYPVVDGYVFVRIGQKNPEYKTEGQRIVDEFFAVEKVSLAANETKPISFTWTPNKSLSAKNYRADYFFSVGKKFNLGGLPFTNEVIVGFSDFSITSDFQSDLMFDKSTTLVNGSKYNHIGAWPSIVAGEKAVISQVLKNNTEVKKTASVYYDLFYWDSLDEADKVSTKKETVNVEARSQVALSYTIPKVDTSVYYLRITAVSTDGQKSIVNVRVVSEQERPRLNYPAINKFPLKAGDDFTLFACFHNSSSVDTSGQVKVVLTDKKGNEIGKLDYKGVISSGMGAQKVDLKALTDLSTLNLKAEIYNKDGKVVDSYKTIYTTEAVKSSATKEVYVLWAIVLVAIILLIVAGKISSRKGVKILLNTLLILIAVTAIGALLTKYVLTTEAETVSADGKTKTETSSTSYQVAWDKRSYAVGSSADSFTGVDKIFAVGTISYTNSVTLSGDTSLTVDDTVSFSKISSGTFNTTGGAYGTPNLGQIESGSGQCDDDPVTCYSELKWSDPVSPTMTLTSSNTSVMTCSGSTCTAVGSGTATVTAAVSSAITNYQASYKNNEGQWYCNYSGSVLNHSGTTCLRPATSSGYWYHVISLLNLNGTTWSATNLSKTLPGYSPTWTFTVTAPALSVDCFVSPSTAGLNENVTWTADADGGVSPYTYVWSEDVSGTSVSEVETYTSYGNYDGRVTVTDSTGATTTSPLCSNVVSGGSGTGVSVSSSTVNGVCSTLPQFCLDGTPVDMADTSTHYRWSCNGVNGGTDASCEASIDGGGDPVGNFNCSIAGPSEDSDANGKVDINTKTTWTLGGANNVESGYNWHWTIYENGATTTVSQNSTPLTRFFDTQGVKAVDIYFSSSTAAGTWTCNNSAAAITTVIVPGSQNER